MVALAAQALLLLGIGQIQVVLAPDQPVPYVYAGEPLIIELVSPRDTTCTVAVEIVSFKRTVQTLPSDQTVRLLADRPRWITAGELPPLDGPHTVRTSITQDGVVIEHISTVHHIERAGAPDTIPFSISTASLSEELLWTLRSLPAGTLRLDASAPDVLEQAKRARDELGWRIHLRVDDTALSGAGALQELIGSLSGRVDAWEVVSSQGPSHTLGIVRSLG